LLLRFLITFSRTENIIYSIMIHLTLSRSLKELCVTL
jgi:hypothetical protein